VTTRITLDVPDEKFEEIKLLCERLRLATRKDLFNNAITLLQWAEEQIASGRVIASVDDEAKSFRELQMPIFENIQRRDV
jgi:hypothetical protein